MCEFEESMKILSKQTQPDENTDTRMMRRTDLQSSQSLIKTDIDN